MKYGLDKLFWTVCQNSQPSTTRSTETTPVFRRDLPIDWSRTLVNCGGDGVRSRSSAQNHTPTQNGTPPVEWDFRTDYDTGQG